MGSSATNMLFAPDAGATPLLGFVRLRIVLGGTSPNAHVKITAVGRDYGAESSASQRVDVVLVCHLEFPGRDHEGNATHAPSPVAGSCGALGPHTTAWLGRRRRFMQKMTVLALDDIVNSKGYSPDQYSKILGECDQLNIYLLIDQPPTTSGGTSVKLVLEHSGDGLVWMPKNSTPEINNVALGASPLSATFSVSDPGTKPSLGLVRFRLELTNSTTGFGMVAKVKLYVTARDRGAGRPINEEVALDEGIIVRSPALGVEADGERAPIWKDASDCGCDDCGCNRAKVPASASSAARRLEALIEAERISKSFPDAQGMRRPWAAFVKKIERLLKQTVNKPGKLTSDIDSAPPLLHLLDDPDPDPPTGPIPEPVGTDTAIECSDIDDLGEAIGCAFKAIADWFANIDLDSTDEEAEAFLDNKTCAEIKQVSVDQLAKLFQDMDDGKTGDPEHFTMTRALKCMTCEQMQPLINKIGFADFNSNWDGDNRNRMLMELARCNAITMKDLDGDAAAVLALVQPCNFFKSLSKGQLRDLLQVLADDEKGFAIRTILGCFDACAMTNLLKTPGMTISDLAEGFDDDVSLGNFVNFTMNKAVECALSKVS
ncbi:Hypothetical protein A7982_11844 [Minicystis rosea]|nr:Hypothetical protein A7982_11844 [Minicystis rosea]